MRELIKANGGDWGGTSVDREYLDFIKCLIGDSVTQDLEQNAPHVFFDVCKEFEHAKRSITPECDIIFNVRIPIQLGEMYKKMHPKEDLRSKEVVVTKHKKRVKISFMVDKLRLTPEDAKDFFTESTDAITSHVKTLLQRSKMDITTIILVGGFAESQMLTQAVKSEFPEMRLIIPHEAASSVLRGAVIFGHDPSLIKERRSKYTYGIEVFDTFDSSTHDEKYKYKEDGALQCGDLFNKIIEIDEPVTVGEYQNEKSFIIHTIGKDGNLHLYSSLKQNPKYVDEKECCFIGSILSPGHDFLSNETINVMMRFGETEIEIKAYQPKSDKTMRYYLGQ